MKLHPPEQPRKRPERHEFFDLFFPELKQQNSGSDREAYIRLSTATCEAILHDFVKLFDKGLAQHGRGILVIRLHKGLEKATDATDYLTVEDLRHDLEAADGFGHTELRDLFREALSTAESVNTNVWAAVMLVDNSSARVYLLDRSNPSGEVRGMLEEMAKQ